MTLTTSTNHGESRRSFRDRHLGSPGALSPQAIRIAHGQVPDARTSLIYRELLQDRHSWDDLIRRRHLVPLTVDIAHQATIPATPTMRAHALRDQCPPTAVIGGTSATWIHFPELGAELAGLIPKGATIPHWRQIHRGPVTCLYPSAKARPIVRAGAECSLRQTRFYPGDLQQIVQTGGDPLLVTSPARTVLDLICTIPGTALFPALAAFARGGVDLVAVQERLDTLKRWRGRAGGNATLAAYLRTVTTG